MSVSRKLDVILESEEFRAVFGIVDPYFSKSSQLLMSPQHQYDLKVRDNTYILVCEISAHPLRRKAWPGINFEYLNYMSRN